MSTSLIANQKPIGRLHLHANIVRYERPRKPSDLAGHVHAPCGSYVTVVKGNTQSNALITPPSTILALVLDDSCVIERDLSWYVMGRVMIELDNEVTKQKMLQHIGVKSWFQVSQAAKQDFVSDERVVWVDIKGVLLNLWTRETFLKIGKVYMLRAKELFTWTLIFLDYKESEYISDDESLHGAKNKSVGLQYGDDELEDDSDVEGVSETNFSDKPSSPNNSVCKSNEKVVEQHSEDPFNIYDLLKQNPKGDTQDSNTTFSHPPGFTPEVISTSQEVHENVTSKGEYALHSTYNSQTGDTNGLIRFKKKLQDLKKIIRSWVKDKNTQQSGAISSIKNELIAIDKNLDSGNASDEILFKRMELMQQLHDIK
ncbi:hypothetical protein Tco_0409463 [Tanacetum coccineum]